MSGLLVPGLPDLNEDKANNPRVCNKHFLNDDHWMYADDTC